MLAVQKGELSYFVFIMWFRSTVKTGVKMIFILMVTPYNHLLTVFTVLIAAVQANKMNWK